MKRLTIGYVLDDTLDVTDGVQAAMITIAEHIRSLGNDVHYIVVDTKRTDLDNIHSIGSFYRMKFNGNSVRTPKKVANRAVAQLFEEVTFDILHVQMPFSPVFAASIIRNAPSDAKIFGTFHILPYGMLTTIGTYMLGVAIKRECMRIVQAYAVSEPALAFMERTFRIPGEILPNPIDYDFYHSHVTKSLQSDIVYLGRFDQRKGPLQLLRAYAELDSSTQAKHRLVMCGKGPLHAQAMALADQLGCKNVVFTGFVSEDEKATYLANAMIAVFPSISGESFGIVLAEAMASGAGVTIGGNNPGYASVLGQWKSTLFDARDITAISDTLQLFIDDVQLRKRIGGQQHQHVLSYDIKKIAQELLVEYRSVL